MVAMRCAMVEVTPDHSCCEPVQALANGLTDPRRRAADHNTHCSLHPAGRTPRWGTSNDRVDKRLLSGSPADLELTETSILLIGTAPVEGVVAVFAGPPDGSPE